MRRFAPTTFTAVPVAISTLRCFRTLSVADRLQRRQATEETSAFYSTASAASDRSSIDRPAYPPSHLVGHALPAMPPSSLPSTVGSGAARTKTSAKTKPTSPMSSERVFLNLKGNTDLRSMSNVNKEPADLLSPRVDGARGGEVVGNDRYNQVHQHGGFSVDSILEATLPHDAMFGERAGGLGLGIGYGNDKVAYPSPNAAPSARYVSADSSRAATSILAAQRDFEQRRFECEESTNAKHNFASFAEMSKVKRVEMEVREERAASGNTDPTVSIAERAK